MIPEKSLFKAIGNGALIGGKTALIVGAMLITYIGLLAMINFVLENLVGVTFLEIIGYVFAPVAFNMGIPASEIVRSGSIMGTKVAANEFVAMLDFMNIIPEMSPKKVLFVATLGSVLTGTIVGLFL
ncbi:nucleoside transporter C-terminal domain-containing protein [Neobacillus sp. SCS-31]|uniref:nucleoside transporter C-terminal domain-containing protein n=1 Tax=Neobacillus oceani TaxID=3115292 RepID=UPI0039068DAB